MIDEHGFAYQTWVAPSINWGNEDEITSNYIADVKELLSTLLDGRIESVWRPIVEVVDQRRNFLAKYNENFRFYYLSNMTKDEVCVFKVFDSEDTKAHCVPRASFWHRDFNSPDLPPRESIEVRLLVLSEHGTTKREGSEGN
ncbi:hypothetical protein BDD12DRAFT_800806 [Trichophaea hybrida]|nr:hypothetical protein BDD12DRAFT_800806 [Trichophaea hybrida]